jgi:uncharacterized Zn-finger protein
LAAQDTEPRDMTIEAPETEIVSTWRVACDGGEGALGHPRVWLTIPQDKGYVECGYCDKKFVHESFAEKAK